MGARVERLPWERQPREGEEAYAAFLAYRDLGPWRTHEATRMRLGKRPGYLKPIERWSALRDWRGGPCAWDDHLQAERDKVAAEEAAKWERRRLQALEEGWQTLPGAAGQAGADARHRPRRRRPSPRPSRPRRCRRPSPTPSRRPRRPRTTAGRGPTRWNDMTVARLAKLVVELEWALLNEALPPPGKFDPLTATDEEIKAYLVLHPRFGRPPPR